jgi:hypothetical protein
VISMVTSITGITTTNGLKIIRDPLARDSTAAGGWEARKDGGVLEPLPPSWAVFPRRARR